MTSRKRCPICGSTDVHVDSPSEYAYEHSGLPNVILQGPGIVRITTCENCDHVTTVVRDEQQLLQVLGMMLVLRPSGMTGQELRYLRGLYEMTQAELASALGVPRRETIAEWERKGRIFAVARDEITPRLGLLHLFRERVLESDHCALLEPHVEAYEEFAASFVEYAGAVLGGHERPSGPAGFNVRLKQRKRWSADLVPA